MSELRSALEASMNDIALGTDDRLARAEARIVAAALAAVDTVALSEESLPGDGFDSWADGFRQGWRAAREAIERLAVAQVPAPRVDEPDRIADQGIGMAFPGEVDDD